MSAADLLRDVVRGLDAAGIPHMLVGSFASTSHGAPRTTQAAQGGSDRQVADAAAVLAVAGDGLDDGYLDEWAGRLGVTELLARARGG